MYQKHVSNLKELKTHDYKQTIRPHDTFLCIKPHASLSTCVAGRADGYLLTARSLPIWKDVITQMRSLDGRLIAIALFALKLRSVHFLRFTDDSNLECFHFPKLNPSYCYKKWVNTCEDTRVSSVLSGFQALLLQSQNEHFTIHWITVCVL